MAVPSAEAAPAPPAVPEAQARTVVTPASPPPRIPSQLRRPSPTGSPVRPQRDAFRAIATPARLPTTPGVRANPFATPAHKPALHMTTPSRTRLASPAPPAQPQRRLVIHKLVLENFKSYAGRQDIGPFHKSFSSVVGPNGSGKSNVIDALLFVFGWRANKMRQGRLSELIHNSEGRTEIPSCTVEVWFQDIVDVPGNESFTVVPQSRLVIARTALRNNQSQYSINGKRSNYTEVTTLLRSRGIDLDHKRFLILQGEVESIAQMPPKAKTEHDEGLLEYLEDIIGTSHYKGPIEEQAQQVDTANEARAEKLQRLKIVQRELEHLEPRRREAEQYLRDHNTLTKRQSALWQARMLECRTILADVAAAEETLRATLAAENEKHAGADSRAASQQKEADELAEAAAALAAEYDRINAELAQTEKAGVQLQAKRRLVDGKRKKLSKSANDDHHALSEALAAQQNASAEAERLHEELRKHEEDLVKEEAALDSICEQLRSKTQSFNDALQAKQRELGPWTAKITDENSARHVAATERDLLASRSVEAAERANEALNALQELKDGIESRRAQISRLEDDRDRLAAKAEEDSAMLGQMKEREAELHAAATNARRQADDARAAAAASRAHGDVNNSLLRQAELGLITGYYGRLGALGTINDRYDVAISTAVPGLSNLVVESVDVGQKCIEYLRKHSLGRANFVLLQSLNIRPEAMRRIPTPENVPRLFDLVEPREPKFAPAFYHQMRDTLVANDLAQAKRIAYGAKRWRVVTLDGQLIDKSGTMSGGGGRVMRGAMSATGTAEVTPEHAAKLERIQRAAEDELRTHQMSLAQLEELCDKDAARLPEIERQLKMLEMEVRAHEERLDEATARAEEMQAPDAPDAGDTARIAELDKVLQKHDRKIASLKEASAAIEAEIASLQEQILEAGGMDLRTQKSKVEGIREMIELNGERIAKAQLAQAKGEKDTARLQLAIAKTENEVAELDEELASLDKQTAQHDKAVADARSKAEQTQDALESKREEHAQITAALEEHAESLRAFRKLQVDIEQKLQDAARRTADTQKQHRALEKKHAQLYLHQVSEPEAPKEAPEADSQKDAVKGEEPVDGESMDGESMDEEQDEQQETTAEEPDTPAEEPDGLPTIDDDELRALNLGALEKEIAELSERLENGHADLAVLDEYHQREQEFLARAGDLEETTRARDTAQQQYESLRKERLERFMTGFTQISAKLKEMYQTITLGGNAELELVDSLDPFSEGIIFSVMPPKKSWKNISNLSGGEKTLSSLALVFALHVYKPTPLYVMDEIDAALDFRNVSIIANLIKERTRGAQFIIISLRNNMFELSSRLVGVYKTHNCTKSLTIANTDLHAKSPVCSPSKSPAMPS
ncbi:Structural maintenance of chromosomes protein 4 [Malassezia cuniculi]|uniref:Structural maintenance of chromosomes protein n=1 Tax=Malassezia cuniculi TaxID=948313 RepID=A0AAF0J6J6_9BASI|nr:Structural maintenance of chromosomes protein 4 [Malassezia cuniculi]